MTVCPIETIFLEERPLLDVRAPVEYQKGAFPTAVNLPLLDDQQRTQVGICYKRDGQEAAIQLGERLLTPEMRQTRIAQWSDFAMQNPGGYLYCFRGGKRSRYTQQWLRENSIDYPLVPGGYKKMRTYLLEQLERYSSTLPFVLVSGKTGSGKTDLLSRLPHYVDLEALARHRGSSFGATHTSQPSIINFENSLAIELLKAAHKKPGTVYLEDEGKLIGRLAVPDTLRSTMLSLPCVLLIESIERRVEVSSRTYIAELLNEYCRIYGTEEGTTRFINHHKTALQKIKKRFGTQKLELAIKEFDTGMQLLQREGHMRGFNKYIELLLTQYYDPMYEYQFRSKNRKVLFSGNFKEIVDWCNDRNT
jgi:tRNA 2-selenouridine synthase